MNEKTKDKLCLMFPGNRKQIRASDLSDMEFHKLDLTQLDFSDADFGRSEIVDCKLSQSILCRANFYQTLIKDCIIEAADLTNVEFKYCVIVNTKFDNSLMVRSSLYSEEIKDCSFIRVNFTGAKFQYADYSGCHFDDCCLDSITGFKQKVMKGRFTDKFKNLDFWRAIDKHTNKSCLGVDEEVTGKIVEVPISEVSLDARSGCSSGLHVCKTKKIAQAYGKAHYEDYQIIKVRLKNKSDLLCVHLSGEFARTNKFEVLMDGNKEE